jgi:hypothetical protein
LKAKTRSLEGSGGEALPAERIKKTVQRERCGAFQPVVSKWTTVPLRQSANIVGHKIPNLMKYIDYLSLTKKSSELGRKCALFEAPYGIFMLWR